MFLLLQANQVLKLHQAEEVLRAMEADAGVSLPELKVDGGASANNFLMKFQADLIGRCVRRPKCIETTALGAAYLAGLETGYWKDRDDIVDNWSQGRAFEPTMDEETRAGLLKGWKRAVRAALAWAED